MKKNLSYINFVKGLACIGVFLHHFFLIALPATYTGNSSDSKIIGDYLFGCTPLGFILNGNFWVCTFLMISSFLIAKNVFEKNSEKYIVSTIIKRYPRLMIPVLAINIIYFFIYKILSSFGMDILNNRPDTFLSTVKYSIFDIWFTNNSTNLYWMMFIMFSGSFISVIVAMILKHIKKTSYSLILTGLITLIFSVINTLFVATMFGIIIAYLYNKNLFSKIRKIKFYRVISYFILIFSLYLGGFPSYYGQIENLPLLYSVFKLLPRKYIPIHIIGSAFLIFAMIILFDGKDIFDKKIFNFLGDISFSVYLVHDLANVFLAELLLSAFSEIIPYGLSVLTTAVIMIVTVIIVSTVFCYGFEKRCGKAINKIFYEIIE